MESILKNLCAKSHFSNEIKKLNCVLLKMMQADTDLIAKVHFDN